MNVSLALLIAFAADRVLGDPACLPHMVVLIGRGIARLERELRPIFSPTPRAEFAAGCLLAALVAGLAYGGAALALGVLGAVSGVLAFLAACFLGFQALATKSLAQAALRVHTALARDDIAAAREAVGRIVGRDVSRLDAGGIARATVETVAENASDGVAAPLFYFAVGGAPLAVLYKAVNTMDSMLGYRNSRYQYFGRAAARLDDVANFIPARLTALALVAAARLCGLDWRGAWRVYRRDHAKHASPNAGHPEAACAGALGVRLGGPSSYGGQVVDKPGIGDGGRDACPEDILRAVRLMRAGSGVALLGCLLLSLFAGGVA